MDERTVKILMIATVEDLLMKEFRCASLNDKQSAFIQHNIDKIFDDTSPRAMREYLLEYGIRLYREVVADGEDVQNQEK